MTTFKLEKGRIMRHQPLMVGYRRKNRIVVEMETMRGTEIVGGMRIDIPEAEMEERLDEMVKQQGMK